MQLAKKLMQLNSAEELPVHLYHHQPNFPYGDFFTCVDSEIDDGRAYVEITEWDDDVYYLEVVTWAYVDSWHRHQLGIFPTPLHAWQKAYEFLNE